ncbi:MULTISPECIES: S-layer homology domain-containing protein [unclassified Anabaena]|uniref:S-layer homology domain-containing protein n=1 Tax=unclassified Anabaena TaxID=2619674 RepID=UPI0039C7619F
MFESINPVDIKNHWAQQCITQLVSRQIVKGYPDQTFRPEGTITRAEFAVILQKAFAKTTDEQTNVNVPPLNQDVYFSDVPKSHWAYNAIQIAAYRNFVVGYPNGTFQPNQNISRVQAIAVIRNIFNFPEQKNTEQVLKQYFDDWQTIPA